MRQPKQILIYAFTACLLLAGFWWLVGSGRDAPVQAPARWTSISDPEPHVPACAFWKPWQQLVAPSSPQVYLDKIKRRLAEPSTRSGEYQALIARSTGVLAGTTESVCIAGRFTPTGAYHLEGSDARTCETLPATFLDSTLELSVERLGEGGFINELNLAIGMEDVDPESLWPFLHDQALLMLKGYRGWSKAYPRFFEQTRSGFGLIGPEPLGTESTRLRYAWQTQTMRAGMPKWADYLMLLSDLVSMRTSFLGEGSHSFLDTRIETVMTGMALTVPQATLTYLAAPTTTPLTVAHDIQVRFRGLEILLKGMRFAGTLTPAADGIVYAGKFTGVEEVSVSGAYRGMVGGSIGQMIHDIVREHLRTELERLTTGNRGEGWTFRIALETRGAANMLTYKTSFQSPVNFLNLLREDKDKTNSPVLPNARALAELNQWASGAVGALLSDFAMASCQL